MRPNDHEQILNYKTPKHKNLTKNTNTNVNNFLLQKYLLKKQTIKTQQKTTKQSKNIYMLEVYSHPFSLSETFYVRKKFQWMFFFEQSSVSR